MNTVIKRAWCLASIPFLLCSLLISLGLTWFASCWLAPTPAAARGPIPGQIVRAQDPLDISTQQVYDPDQLLGSGLYQVTASAKTMENRNMHLLVALVDTYGELTGTQWNQQVLELSKATKDTYLISLAIQAQTFSATATEGSQISSSEVNDIATQVAAPMFSSGEYAQGISAFVSQLIDHSMLEAGQSSQLVPAQENTNSGMAKWVIVVLLLAMVVSVVLALFIYRRNVGPLNPGARAGGGTVEDPPAHLAEELPTAIQPQLQAHHLHPADDQFTEALDAGKGAPLADEEAFSPLPSPSISGPIFDRPTGGHAPADTQLSPEPVTQPTAPEAQQPVQKPTEADAPPVAPDDPDLSAALAAKAAQEQRLAGIAVFSARKARRKAKAEANATQTETEQPNQTAAASIEEPTPPTAAHSPVVPPVPTPPANAVSMPKASTPAPVPAVPTRAKTSTPPSLPVPATPPAPAHPAQPPMHPAQPLMPRPTPAASAHTDLDMAGQTVVKTDNALLAASEDLAVSQDRFGPAATRSFATALAQGQDENAALLAQLAQGHLDQEKAVQIAQQSAAIVSALKRHVDSFTKLRHRPSAVNESLQTIKEKGRKTALALANAEATWQKLRQTYPQAHLDYTAANLARCKALLGGARKNLAAAEQKIVERDAATAIRYLRGAERAFTRIDNATGLLRELETELSFTTEQLRNYPAQLQASYQQAMAAGVNIAPQLSQHLEKATQGANAALSGAANPRRAIDQLISVTNELAQAVAAALGGPAGARAVAPSLPLRYELLSLRQVQLYGHLSLRREQVPAPPRALLAYSSQLAFEAQNRGKVDPLVAVQMLAQSQQAAQEALQYLPVTVG